MKREFELTKDHITLLRHMYVGWQNCEFGAPEIDPKRPYGNSDVVTDIAEILEVEVGEDGLDQATESRLTQLHYETQTALQILLSTASVCPGNYECEGYEENWRFVDG